MKEKMSGKWAKRKQYALIFCRSFCAILRCFFMYFSSIFYQFFVIFLSFFRLVELLHKQKKATRSKPGQEIHPCLNAPERTYQLIGGLPKIPHSSKLSIEKIDRSGKLVMAMTARKKTDCVGSPTRPSSTEFRLKPHGRHRKASYGL